MKKNYIAPRSKTFELLTRNGFANLTLSNVKGQGTGRGSGLTIGDGGTEDDYEVGGYPDPTVKGYSDWDE